MFKYKEKTAFTYNIQSVVHCRKFSMKQNVDVSFPGPGIFKKKNPGLSRRRGNPDNNTANSIHMMIKVCRALFQLGYCTEFVKK